jgi:hypothetical protein
MSRQETTNLVIEGIEVFKGLGVPVFMIDLGSANQRVCLESVGKTLDCNEGIGIMFRSEWMEKEGEQYCLDSGWFNFRDDIMFRPPENMNERQTRRALESLSKKNDPEIKQFIKEGFSNLDFSNIAPSNQR